MTTSISDYNLWLVFLSFLVSCSGALAGLITTNRIPRGEQGIHLGWLGLSAVLCGGGAVWAMHFLGMLAFRPDIPIAYDIQLTAISLMVPIAMFCLGLYVAFRWRNTLWTVVAGIVMGLGIAAMHYTGMAAMRIGADVSHDHTLFVLSIVIAVVASIAALAIILHTSGAIRYLSSAVMALAVSGMHYTAMAAMRLTPTQGDVEYFQGAVNAPQMLLLVVTTVMLVYVCSIALIHITAKHAPESALLQ